MFFFFKHKTAYEMRISDWSSDVCSSDLEIAPADVGGDAVVGDAGHEEAAIAPQQHAPAALGFRLAIEVAGVLHRPRLDVGDAGVALVAQRGRLKLEIGRAHV